MLEKWRITAAVTTVLVVAVATVTWMGRASADAKANPSTANTAPANSTQSPPPTITQPEATDPVLDWKPPKQRGQYEGYCKDGQPVVTKRPADEWGIRPSCKGDNFGTESLSMGEKPLDPLDPNYRWPKMPIDFTSHVTLRLNGNFVVDPRHEIDVFPYISKQNRTLIPARWVAEAIGGKIGWTADTQEVTATWKDRSVTMWIGKPEAVVNGRTVSLDQAPTLQAGRTMVPARLVTEALGATVKWDSYNAIVNIELDGALCPPAYCWDRRFETK